MIFSLAACGKKKQGPQGEPGKDGINGIDGKDGVTPTIEISADGYWVINGEKTNVKATSDGGTSTPENPQGLDFYLKDDGTYAVAVGNAGYLSKITIPATYLGKAVTEIARQGFQSCQKLTEIVIPDSVTSFNYGAFMDCSSLASVTIPDSVTYIGENAFLYCSNLTSIDVDPDNAYYKSIDGNLYTKDDKTMIQYAIGNQDTSFVIPDGVTSIGDAAFLDCSSLTSVVIPDSVTSIGGSAFANCSSLTTINYRGTEAQWNEITKYSYWNHNTGNYTVVYNYNG